MEENMEEKVLPTYNQYVWKTAIFRVAAAMALGMTVISGVHGIKAISDSSEYLSFSPKITTTAQEELANSKLPHEIESDIIYSAESLAIAGLSGYVAIRQYRRNKKEGI